MGFFTPRMHDNRKLDSDVGYLKRGLTLVCELTGRRAKGCAMSKLTLKKDGDRSVVVTRRFTAPPEAVYRAHTEPILIQKWLLGPDGWTMPVCISEARPGGKIRYEWTNGKRRGFHLTGEYIELVPFSRIVRVERMHLPRPMPDNHIETGFEPDGDGTLMTMRLTLPNAVMRAVMLANGMERQMEEGYARLEAEAGEFEKRLPDAESA
jgi:uncharacterized protein YndB with AHSA1/START domain